MLLVAKVVGSDQKQDDRADAVDDAGAASSPDRSSEHARRGFCGACGTSLFFESTHEPDTIDIAVAALHDADKLAPRFHQWTNSKLAWEMIADKLPRFREGGGSLKMT